MSLSESELLARHKDLPNPKYTFDIITSNKLDKLAILIELAEKNGFARNGHVQIVKYTIGVDLFAQVMEKINTK